MSSPNIPSPPKHGNFSLTEKKKLLSLAKQLKAAFEKRENYARQANNLLKTSGITYGEYLMPTTNKARNVMRRFERFENMMRYTDTHKSSVARKIIAHFPTIAHMSHNNIIRNTAESIRRHEKALKNIHSGRYQTHGRR